MKAELLPLLPIWYAAFLLSITCHEAAHAFTAKLGRDTTAEDQGQVSISPMPHIRQEPFGTVVFPLLSYLLNGWMIGWASAPYDPDWASRHPKRSAAVSLAGPIANLLLALLAALFIFGGVKLGYFATQEYVHVTDVVIATTSSARGAAKFFSILFSLNVLLCAFNLLPIPPLDGISALGLLADDSMAEKLRDIGHNRQFSFIGIIFAWQLFDHLFPPIFGKAVDLLYAVL